MHSYFKIKNNNDFDVYVQRPGHPALEVLLSSGKTQLYGSYGGYDVYDKTSSDKKFFFVSFKPDGIHTDTTSSDLVGDFELTQLMA